MNNNNEKRLFPRMQANCPVLFRLGKEKSWKVAKISNLSATGIQFVSTENPPISTNISIHIKPGSKKTIPEIIASGMVVRAEVLDDDTYAISCRLTEVLNK